MPAHDEPVTLTPCPCCTTKPDMRVPCPKCGSFAVLSCRLCGGDGMVTPLVCELYGQRPKPSGEYRFTAKDEL